MKGTTDALINSLMDCAGNRAMAGICSVLCDGEDQIAPTEWELACNAVAKVAARRGLDPHEVVRQYDRIVAVRDA